MDDPVPEAPVEVSKDDPEEDPIEDPVDVSDDDPEIDPEEDPEEDPDEDEDDERDVEMHSPQAGRTPTPPPSPEQGVYLIRNDSAPPHFCKSSGGVARHILQQLQTMNIVDFDSKGGKKITSSGQRDLDQVAGRIVVVAA
ncbi:hypothetical protein POM88_045770 [Heracleum sosnowskyi]|uniref:Uncharacterized protein n=1 Tax=Heracleum sosnowskyi TaxID=360622 RepID=A0AAD8H6J5_9APIA|nr:hypothetical protein POM88_045770 [Heracleum sosnowskyi]